MATVLRSGIVPILQAIQGQLVALKLLTADQIHFVARNQVPHFVGDQDILLRPGRFLSNEAWNVGGGRTSTAFRRYLEVFPRTRLVLDEADRDTIWLTDAAAGHFALEEAIVDALHLFLPVDASNNALLIEPMRIVDGQAPEKDRDDPLWGEAGLTFEVFYLFNANQAVQ